MIQLEAELIGENRWIVRPGNQSGACGSWPYLWTMELVEAATAEAAIEATTYAKTAYNEYTHHYIA